MGLGVALLTLGVASTTAWAGSAGSPVKGDPAAEKSAAEKALSLVYRKTARQVAAEAGIVEISPPAEDPRKVSLDAVAAGYTQVFTDVTNGTYVGSNGAATCVGVMIVSDNGTVVVGHYAEHSPWESLAAILPKACMENPRAYVWTEDSGYQEMERAGTAITLGNAIDFLRCANIPIVGFVNDANLFVNNKGRVVRQMETRKRTPVKDKVVYQNLYGTPSYTLRNYSSESCAQAAEVNPRAGCGVVNECRNKPLRPELCGYPEMSDTSTPPKKFRHRVISSSAALVQCGPMPTADCSIPTCPGSRTFSFSGGIPGIPFAVNFAGSLSLVGVDNGVATYETSCSIKIGDDPARTDSCRIRGADCCSGSFTGYNGQTITIPTGREYNVVGEFNYVYWQPADSGCVQTGVPLIPVTGDRWDVVSQYSPDGCSLSETNQSFRVSSDMPSCSMPSGTHAALPCTSPADCYGSAAVVSTTRLQRTVDGVGCYWTGYDHKKSGGQVTEALSDEDTVGDAVARASSLVSWSDWGTATVGACVASEEQRLNGFSWSLTDSELRVTLNLPERYTRDIDVSTFRRPLGPAGEFTLLRVDKHRVTGDATNRAVLVVPVPREVGFESYCYPAAYEK